MKKNNLTFNLITILFALLIFGVFTVKAQEPTDEEDFVNTSLINLFSKLAEKESKDANEIESRQEEAKQTQKDLAETRRELTGAESTLRNRLLTEALAKQRLSAAYNPQGGMKSIDENKIAEAEERLGVAVGKRSEAETQVRVLRERLQSQNERLSSQQTLISAAQRRIEIEQPKRIQQKTSLETLAKQWRENSTKENFNLLSEQITVVAAEENTTAAVLWRSEPKQGVIVKYQTVRSRERGETPGSSNNPTNTSEAENITIGNYYIWSEDKDGNPISDKNREVKIKVTTTSLTVLIDR
jgi:hypothetical protein